jgi:hypothetical protein
MRIESVEAFGNRRRIMGRNVTISIGALILLVIVVAIIF